MDTTVTARIPVELKDQVIPILRTMGETTSSLIGAAFAYVLATGDIPRVKPDRLGRRALRADEIAKLEERAAAMTLPARHDEEA